MTATQAHNIDEQLEVLAEEFSGTIEQDCATEKAGPRLIAAAKRLVEGAFSTHTIVVPNEIPTTWAGDGSGEWVPVMLFVPHSEITD